MRRCWLWAHVWTRAQRLHPAHLEEVHRRAATMDDSHGVMSVAQHRRKVLGL